MKSVCVLHVVAAIWSSSILDFSAEQRKSKGPQSEAAYSVNVLH